LFSIQIGKQRLENRRSAFRGSHRFRRWKRTALANEGHTVSGDPVFPSRAQWPSTVRGTERTVNGHVRLLLKVCSSPTLHQPRVGRNERGGTGLSQDTGLNARRPRRPVPCSPATGRTIWELEFSSRMVSCAERVQKRTGPIPLRLHETKCSRSDHEQAFDNR
jgi:hypothetical protein